MAETLEQEVERLRAEIESHRQRELEELRSQLAAARVERDNYRTEAYRNADLVHQLDVAHRETIERLRRELETVRAVSARRGNLNGA